MIKGAYKNPNMLLYFKNLFFSSQLTVNYLSIFLSVCLCLSAHLSMYLPLQLDLNTNWIICYLRKGRHAMEMEKKHQIQPRKNLSQLCARLCFSNHIDKQVTGMNVQRQTLRIRTQANSTEI